MQDFDTISAALLKHLPRPHVGSLFKVSLDEISIAAPGISVGDIAALLAELTGEAGFLPDDMPINDLRLETLHLQRTTDSWGADFEFVVGWNDVSLRLGDKFPLKMAKVLFKKHGRRLLATADVEMRLDDLELKVQLDLPSQFIKGQLQPADHGKALAFLKNRNLTTVSSGVKLRDLSVIASIPFQFLSVHLEIDNLAQIGPLMLTSAMAEVVLSGQGAGSSVEVTVDIVVTIDNHDPLLIHAEGDVDAHGWRVAGALDGGIGDFTIGHLVESIAGNLRKANPELPAVPELPTILNTLKLAHIGASMDTHSDDFQLDCTLAWSHDAELVLYLKKSGAQFLISGGLTIEGVIFNVTFEKNSGMVLVGTFDAAGHATMTLDQLITSMSGGTTPFRAGGSGIDLGVKSVAVALDSQANVLMAAELSAGIDLSRLGDLPLVGNLLDIKKPLGLEISPTYVATGFLAEAAQEIASLLPDNLKVEGGFAEGFTLRPRLLLGEDVITFDSLNLGGDMHKGKAPQLPPSNKPSAFATPMPSGTDITWKEVSRTLGPLHIERVGYGFNKVGPELDLVFEASFAIAGLELSVDGFGARYNFDTQVLEPRLQGLGIDLKHGPLELGGAFLNIDGDFAGEIIVGTPQFSLKALGAFSMIDGTPSMFVYGVLNMPLGGPAFFFVEGLAAGFGVHRKIKMPLIDQLHEFPLIKSAVVSSLGGTASNDPTAQLHALHDYVTPKLGEYFFAAGVKFNSFKLLDGFVVVVVSLGDDFEVDLLGTARFATPPDLPANIPALAKIELDLMARFIASEGLIAVEARLNPHSYVYGPLCHLSGGFAFYTWLKDNSAKQIMSGDFVLSVGGYHPHFKKPAHYPDVPRIELKYQITSEVYIKGSAYFALTPSILMAGGALHMQAVIGSLHAWADLSVDFLVGWEPFHYDALVHLGIGVKWKCFHTSASADLHIWGPKFCGTASVEWSVFSFDVEFGTPTWRFPAPISVSKFKKSFLELNDTAASQGKSLGIVASRGVGGEVHGRVRITPAELTLGLSSKVPINEVQLGTDHKSLNQTRMGVAPCGLTDLGVSKVGITITALDDGRDVSSHFTQTTQAGGFPAALWGQSLRVDKDATPLQAISGIEIQPATQSHEGVSAFRTVAQMKLPLVESPEFATLSRAFLHMGESPTELPVTDLDTLGLDMDELVYVAPKRGLINVRA